MTDRFRLDKDGFDSGPAVRLVFGPGRADWTGGLAIELGLRRVLLVTDGNIAAAGHAARVRRALEGARIEVIECAEVSPEPTLVDVERVLSAARAAAYPDPIDGFIALGGGSVIDAAKGANLLLTNGRLPGPHDDEGLAAPPLPLVTIPTTAGTGSEVQSFALLADPVTHRKKATGHPAALPRLAILDPTLTLTQPRRTTALAGMDTVVHAVECAVTRARSPLSLPYARESFRLAAAALPAVLARPDDLDARGRMQLASAFAGLAIEHSMLGAAHAAANALSARYGLIHGLAVGLTVVEVVRWNAADPIARGLYAELAHAAELPATADALLDTLEALRAACAIPRAIDCGLAPADIPALADIAMQQWTAGFNPRPIGRADFVGLFEAMRA